jgi:hypothetical protein
VIVGTNPTSRRKKPTLVVSTLGSKLFASCDSLVVVLWLFWGKNFLTFFFSQNQKKNASSKSEEKEAGKRRRRAEEGEGKRRRQKEKKRHVWTKKEEEEKKQKRWFDFKERCRRDWNFNLFFPLRGLSVL